MVYNIYIHCAEAGFAKRAALRCPAGRQKKQWITMDNSETTTEKKLPDRCIGPLAVKYFWKGASGAAVSEQFSYFDAVL